MMRSFDSDSKFDKIEKEIAYLKFAGPAATSTATGATVGMVPAPKTAPGTATAGSIPPAAQLTTLKVAWATAPHPESHSPVQILRPGPVRRSLPQQGKRPSTLTPVGIGITGGATAPSGNIDHIHLDPTRPAHERLAASRRASDETSPEVKELRSKLWLTCLAILEAECPGATPEKIISETEKLCSTHWLEILKPSRAGSSAASSSASASTASWAKATLYDPADLLRTTGNYEGMLDLEIGGLIGGTVSQECRGYIFSRQFTGEFRGSVIWRDLNQIMQRNDGLGKATVLEHVLAERQKSGEGVRPYAKRMHTLFIKSAAMDAPFSQREQILHFIRGLQRYLDTARATIRGLQSQGTDYSFDKALGLLITTEAAISHDQHSGRLPMLSRPTANIAACNGQELVVPQRRTARHTRLFQLGLPSLPEVGTREVDCAMRKREVDCAMRKREVDNEAASVDPARVRVAQSSDDDQGGHETQASSQAE
ncbi:hypothetical protein OC842_006473 [Tilletia horrida]|uniref:Uncharacterized protein n=1 Tax=Tilletia horrida TaxID=155126 RepID=A0AAN6G5F4_9BASI|nr:hypothetical protein OC842_006473 [Tilletia horrida]